MTSSALGVGENAWILKPGGERGDREAEMEAELRGREDCGEFGWLLSRCSPLG